MEWVDGKQSLIELLKNYRYVLLVLLVGLVLMFFPKDEGQEVQIQTAITEEEKGLQERLAEILSHVSGAGSVEVLLTQATGEETRYQFDEDLSGEETHRDTVLITDAERTEAGLIRQVNPPSYLGAIILCQGADDANVRLSIVKAVMSVTGLTSDHITVLKMK